MDALKFECTLSVPMIVMLYDPVGTLPELELEPELELPPPQPERAKPTPARTSIAANSLALRKRHPIRPASNNARKPKAAREIGVAGLICA